MKAMPYAKTENQIIIDWISNYWPRSIGKLNIFRKGSYVKGKRKPQNEISLLISLQGGEGV